MWSATSGGTTGVSAPTNSDNAYFDRAGTYTVTGNATALNMSVTAGLVTFNLGINVFGGTAATFFTLGSGNVAAFTASSTTSFSTTTSMTLTTNGTALNTSISVAFGRSGIAGTIVLGSSLTISGTGVSGTSGKAKLDFGSLDLNGYALSVTGPFFINTAAAHTLAFGTTGSITVSDVDANGTAFSLTGTITVTGTPVVNVSYSGSTATNVNLLAMTEANSISFNFTTGTYNLTFLNVASHTARSVSFAGFGGTWLGRTTANTIYGDLTLSAVAGFSVGASTGILTLGSTSATTRVITSNAKVYDGPITISGTSGLYRLADAFTMGSTRALTHTNGSLDLNGKTLTVGTTYTTAAGTKSLTFNGGELRCPAATTTAFNNAAPTGFTTVAGTGTGKIAMTAATAKTFVGGGSTFNCNLSNDGAGALTISGANTFTGITNGVQPTSFIFPSSTTQTLTNWKVSGLSGSIVTITSTTAGTAATLSKASGTAASDYVSLKDSTASGGAAWYAGPLTHSTNVSGNTGWTFTGPPISVSVTGVAATSAVGTPLTGVVTPVNVTGIASTTGIGTTTVTVTSNATVNVTGGSATGFAGSSSITTATSVIFEGWNRPLGWGVGPFGTGAATIGLATGSVGNVTVVVNINVNVTGRSATASVGSPTVAISADAFVTGLSSTARVGTPTVVASASASVTGLASTTAVGNVYIDYTTYIFAVGSASAGQVGSPTVVVDCSTPVVGSQSAGYVGDALAVVNNTIFVVGLGSTTSVGVATAVVNATVNLAGFYATGYVGQVLVWGQIIPGQTPVWTEIDPNFASSWSEITPSQTPVWTEISA